MNFLGGLIAGFAKAMLQWLGELLAKFFQYLYDKYQIFRKREKVDKEAKDSVQPLKDAKTKEEVDAATDSALDGF